MALNFFTQKKHLRKQPTKYQIVRYFYTLLVGMKGHKNIQYIETFMFCTVTDVSADLLNIHITRHDHIFGCLYTETLFQY
jgi:hypothetical protein